MEDPRNAVEKCIDAADEMILALVELKKIFFAILPFCIQMLNVINRINL